MIIIFILTTFVILINSPQGPFRVLLQVLQRECLLVAPLPRQQVAYILVKRPIPLLVRTIPFLGHVLIVQVVISLPKHNIVI